MFPGISAARDSEIADKFWDFSLTTNTEQRERERGERKCVLYVRERNWEWLVLFNWCIATNPDVVKATNHRTPRKKYITLHNSLPKIIFFIIPINRAFKIISPSPPLKKITVKQSNISKKKKRGKKKFPLRFYFVLFSLWKKRGKNVVITFVVRNSTGCKTASGFWIQVMWQARRQGWEVKWRDYPWWYYFSVCGHGSQQKTCSCKCCFFFGVNIY